MDGTDPLEQLTDLVVSRRTADRPFVVALTGSVAVGKSTLAGQLIESLRGRLPQAVVAVVSSDSFLFPNSVLTERGLVLRKGFPESFDLDGMAVFLRSVRAGAGALWTPVYDHFTYDIVDGARHEVGRPDVLLIEGLALLGHEQLDGLVDLSIYLDADVSDIEGWYEHRFVQHALRAADEPGGFWDLFAGLDADQLRDSAAFTWTAINLPNLLDHVAPTRGLADVVVTKSSDHTVVDIALR